MDVLFHNSKTIVFKLLWVNYDKSENDGIGKYICIIQRCGFIILIVNLHLHIEDHMNWYR